MIEKFYLIWKVIFILYILFFPDQSFAANYDKVKWVFIAYHKTGHKFTHILSKLFEDCNAHVLTNSGRYLIQDVIFNLKDNIASLTGPEYQVNWFNRTKDGSMLRYAHFVRDPYDAVLSGYLYHSQIPSPEQWQLVPREVSFICEHTNGNKGKNPEWEDDLFKLYREPFGRYINNITRIDELFAGVMNLCATLSATQEAAIKQRRKENDVKDSKKYNFNEILHAQRGDEFDNIRYMAIWFLIHNGDLLRMAANSLYSNPTISRQIYITDFPIGNKAVFQRSATRLYEFLMGREHNKFWSCMEPLEKAVSVTVREGFIAGSTPKVKKQKDDDDGKGDEDDDEDDDIDDDAIINQEVAGNHLQGKDKSSHVSVGRMTYEQRKGYMDRLKEDAVLGPLLTMVQNILLDRKKLETA